VPQYYSPVQSSPCLNYLENRVKPLGHTRMWPIPQTFPRHGALGHVPLWSLMHAKILQPFFVSTYRPITHITALITVTVAGCCKKTLVIFVSANLTPDGFHFWMTLSPRTSEPVRHAPVPAWSKILATPLIFSPIKTVCGHKKRPVAGAGQQHSLCRVTATVLSSQRSLL